MITAPAGNSMRDDIENAVKSLIEAARCVDRVHRDVFPGMDDFQDDMMKLADDCQKKIREARKVAQKMRIHYEMSVPDPGIEPGTP